MPIEIRPATPADYLLLPKIEADAAQTFIDAGLPSIAAMPPMAADDYLKLPEPHMIFVACTEEILVGFAVVYTLDNQAYLKEVSVKRDNARQGIGRRLIEAVEGWAQAQNYTEILLTTFAEVPFNGPYYKKIGFETFDPGVEYPQLSILRANETKTGLDISPRICMRKFLQKTAG